MSEDESQESAIISREQFDDLPYYTQLALVEAGAAPRDWLPDRPFMYQPEWQQQWQQMGYFGFLSPSGLMPLYLGGAAVRAYRADLTPWGAGIYGYAGRADEAGMRAFNYQQAAAWGGVRGDYYLSQAALWGGRQAYWQTQQTWTPAAELWSGLRMASYFDPNAWTLRGLGFPAYSGLQQLLVAAGQAPYVRQAIQADPAALQRMMTSGTFWAFQYPTAATALWSGYAEWTGFQMAGWYLGGRGRGLTSFLQQTGPISLLQAGLGVAVPPLATLAARNMAGIPTFLNEQERQNFLLQEAVGWGTAIPGAVWALQTGAFAPRNVSDYAWMNPAATARGAWLNFGLGEQALAGARTVSRLGLGTVGWIAGGYAGGWAGEQYGARFGYPAAGRVIGTAAGEIGLSYALSRYGPELATRAGLTDWLVSRIAGPTASRILGVFAPGAAISTGLRMLGPIALAADITYEALALLTDPTRQAMAYQTPMRARYELGPAAFTWTFGQPTAPVTMDPRYLAGVEASYGLGLRPESMYPYAAWQSMTLGLQGVGGVYGPTTRGVYMGGNVYAPAPGIGIGAAITGPYNPYVTTLPSGNIQVPSGPLYGPENYPTLQFPGWMYGQAGNIIDVAWRTQERVWYGTPEERITQAQFNLQYPSRYWGVAEWVRTRIQDLPSSARDLTAGYRPLGYGAAPWQIAYGPGGAVAPPSYALGPYYQRGQAMGPGGGYMEPPAGYMGMTPTQQAYWDYDRWVGPGTVGEPGAGWVTTGPQGQWLYVNYWERGEIQTVEMHPGWYEFGPTISPTTGEVLSPGGRLPVPYHRRAGGYGRRARAMREAYERYGSWFRAPIGTLMYGMGEDYAGPGVGPIGEYRAALEARRGEIEEWKVGKFHPTAYSRAVAEWAEQAGVSATGFWYPAGTAAGNAWWKWLSYEAEYKAKHIPITRAGDIFSRLPRQDPMTLLYYIAQQGMLGGADILTGRYPPSQQQLVAYARTVEGREAIRRYWGGSAEVLGLVEGAIQQGFAGQLVVPPTSYEDLTAGRLGYGMGYDVSRGQGYQYEAGRGYAGRLPTSTARYARTPEEARQIWRGTVEEQRADVISTAWDRYYSRRWWNKFWGSLHRRGGGSSQQAQDERAMRFGYLAELWSLEEVMGEMERRDMIDDEILYLSETGDSTELDANYLVRRFSEAG